MSTKYSSARASRRVSFDWISEAWRLYSSNAALWIAAIIIGLYAPACVDAFIVGAVTLSQKFSGAGAGVHALTHMPAGLWFGLAVLNLAYAAFIWGGVARMAVKQVSGEPISFRDIFSGGPLFGHVLVLGIVSALLVNAGSLLLVLPGVFLAGLLMPAFALVASGETVGAAIVRSVKAMWPDRAIAMGLAFVLGIGLLIGSAFATVGLLAALPLGFLVSALAYRDMIGIPTPEVSLDEILWTVDTTRGVLLSSETPFGYSQGTPVQFSLSGEPLNPESDSAKTADPRADSAAPPVP